VVDDQLSTPRSYEPRSSMTVSRVARVIRLRADKEAEYRELHAAVWPSVLATIARVGITNYSIFLHDGLLFSYFEFVGDSLDAAMEEMAQDPDTQRWWELTDPCQQPVDSAAPGEWWVPAEEHFHVD
jgi:L-rhamnose mutarotase